MAVGSASELEYELLLARDLQYLALPSYEALTTECVELRRMLISLMKQVNP